MLKEKNILPKVNKCHSISNNNKHENCTYKKGNVNSRIYHAVIGIKNKRNIILMLDVNELNTSDSRAIRIEICRDHDRSVHNRATREANEFFFIIIIIQIDQQLGINYCRFKQLAGIF